jgi:hypothetical protein
MKIILVALLLMVFLISGCLETKPGNTTVGNITVGSSVTPEYPPVVDMAKSDLAKRLNISEEQIHFVKQEKKDWPDTSLGFPEEGKMYAQVVTPGFVIILEAGGKQYEYHSDYKRVAGPKEITK